MRRIVLATLSVLLLAGACSSKKDDADLDTTTGDTPAPSLSYADGPPPWPLGDQQVVRMSRAGIEPLKAEGSVVHYHSHLDVFYDGQPVTVPKDIGIDYNAGRISPIHTHANSGVIHVEANKEEDFTLGQFLNEWGIKTSDGCVADKCGDEVAVFVGGSIQDTPAPDLVIKPRTQIALVLGTTRPADIPSTYDCKAEAPADLCPDAK